MSDRRFWWTAGGGLVAAIVGVGFLSDAAGRTAEGLVDALVITLESLGIGDDATFTVGGLVGAILLLVGVSTTFLTIRNYQKAKAGEDGEDGEDGEET